MGFKPTKEQEKIFHFVKNRNENLIIDAKAGCGKTTSIVEATKLIPTDKKKIFLAFNKHIQEELKSKLPEDVHCYTFHGLGISAIKRKYGESIKFDEFKVDNIIRKLASKWNLNTEFNDNLEKDNYLIKIKKLTDFCRSTLTLDKKYLPYLSDKYDVGLKNTVDYTRVFSVLNKLMSDRQSYDFIDMIFLPAIDNSIWMFQYDYVIVDEIQDLNRLQQKIVEKILKRDRITKKIIGRFIGVGDEKQCQPKGTKILMSDGTEKNIEDVNVNDEVVSYELRKSCRFYGFHKYKKGKNCPKIEKINKRFVNENLIVIEGSDKKTKYTSNHKCFVKFRKDKIKAHALYLMEKNGYFRIGITPLWTKDNHDSVSFRAKHEKAEKFWVLNIYDNKFDCYCDEQFFSLKYGIPQLRFKDNKTGLFDQKLIDKFFRRFDKNKLFNSINDLLNEFNRLYEYPLWEKGKKNYLSKNHLFQIQACNIIGDYMQIALFDENNRKNRKHGINGKIDKFLRPKIVNIDKLYYEYYEGYVYSLKVSRFETYVGDGILTHNSIYGFNGVTEKSFEWFRKLPNIKVLPLSYSFRCSRNVIKKAQEIVPEINFLENAVEGVVREGSVLDEPNEGDFVLCRKSAPLMVLFFHYLLNGKKAIIKGNDIGLSLIQMIEGHRSIAQLMAFCVNKLNEYETNLRRSGVLNFEEDSGYSAFKDRVRTLRFLSKLSKDINDMKLKIKQIFSDDLDGIVLSTVHKSKGLEANRVFIARPDILPLSVPKTWQQKQEKNLEYVAITRAKYELIYDNEWTDEDEK